MAIVRQPHRSTQTSKYTTYAEIRQAGAQHKVIVRIPRRGFQALGTEGKFTLVSHSKMLRLITLHEFEIYKAIDMDGTVIPAYTLGGAPFVVTPAMEKSLRKLLTEKTSPLAWPKPVLAKAKIIVETYLEGAKKDIPLKELFNALKILNRDDEDYLLFFGGEHQTTTYKNFSKLVNDFSKENVRLNRSGVRQRRAGVFFYFY